MQCMMSAMAASAGATGARSWLGAKRFHWLNPARLRIVTIALIAAALLVSATLVSGSSAGSSDQHPPANSTAGAQEQPAR